MTNALIAGVGMIPFTKPGKSASYDEMGASAARAALADAEIDYAEVQVAYVGFVYADSTSGQSALYHVGMTGIPVLNVNNNCATGSTALYLARQAVETGAADVVIALGFDQMLPGALGWVFQDRKEVLARHSEAMQAIQGWDEQAPMATQYFGGAGAEYQQKYGADTSTFAKIAVKARSHAVHNPFAIFRQPVTVEEVLQSPHLFGPLTRFQACPPTCGAAAAIVVSPEYAKSRGLTRTVRVAAQTLTTDTESTFTERSMMKLCGYDIARRAAEAAYQQAGLGPTDIQVVELHDCFTSNELISYDALGLTPDGGAEKLVCDGDNTFGGKYVINPSGGLLSKGHPLGATGLAQCCELVTQLRGESGARQVDGAHHALQHNLGLGGACVVTIYGD